MKSFTDKVLAVVAKIPRGKVMSYGEVAAAAGSPGAARAVGNIMMHNNDPKIPCHRVINADGSLGGYNGLQGTKRKLLLKEGVKLK
jgi:methylated-DNA-[protein]-cysteine S-methyltransferase